MTATDSNGLKGQAVFDLQISNTPPTLVLPPAPTIKAGSFASFNVSATDPDAVDTLSFSATGLPPGLSLVDNGNRTATVSGQPIALPGTVQSENYDAGGEGVAYHDTTSGNAGGVYRSNSVDLQATSDSGGGYQVGWTKAGEWLNYTVNVTAAGTYSLDIRVASSGAGGTFHVEVNGVDKTGTLTAPNTGGWQTFQTITKTGVTLAAGVQIIRIVMDTNSATTAGIANMNWFRIR